MKVLEVHKFHECRGSTGPLLTAHIATRGIFSGSKENVTALVSLTCAVNSQVNSPTIWRPAREQIYPSTPPTSLPPINDKTPFSCQESGGI